MNPEKAKKLANILADQDFQDVVEEIRFGIVQKVTASDFQAVDEHHHAVLLLQALNQIMIMLQRYSDEIVMDSHQKQVQSEIDRMRETWA